MARIFILATDNGAIDQDGNFIDVESRYSITPNNRYEVIVIDGKVVALPKLIDGNNLKFPLVDNTNEGPIKNLDKTISLEIQGVPFEYLGHLIPRVISPHFAALEGEDLDGVCLSYERNIAYTQLHLFLRDKRQATKVMDRFEEYIGLPIDFNSPVDHEGVVTISGYGHFGIGKLPKPLQIKDKIAFFEGGGLLTNSSSYLPDEQLELLVSAFKNVLLLEQVSEKLGKNENQRKYDLETEFVKTILNSVPIYRSLGSGLDGIVFFSTDQEFLDTMVVSHLPTALFFQLIQGQGVDKYHPMQAFEHNDVTILRGWSEYFNGFVQPGMLGNYLLVETKTTVGDQASRRLLTQVASAYADALLIEL